MTSGSFGDQTFSPGLATPASEAPGQTHFEASFQIGTALATEQPGLHLSVSPDDGNGARMSYLRFEDRADSVLLINLKRGPGNDDVKIFIDGKKAISGTTWEDYYRYDPEQLANGNQVPSISKLLFREGGVPSPLNLGNGFLVDGVTLSS